MGDEYDPERRHGEVIGGKYTFETKLGQGVAGIVWRANGPNGKVAVKAIEYEPTDDKELGIPPAVVGELSILKSLHHPNVVPLLDVLFDEKHTYLVMPLFTGGTLYSPKLPLTAEDKLKIAGQVLCGMTYLHQRGFLHLDLKPANVLLDDKKNPFIADFGLAQHVPNARTRDPNMLISWPFRPPEMLCGYRKYDKKADLWSYGVFLLEFLFKVKVYANIKEEEYAGWIHKNLKWPKSFRDRLKTEEAEFEPTALKKCKEILEEEEEEEDKGGEEKKEGKEEKEKKKEKEKEEEKEGKKEKKR